MRWNKIPKRGLQLRMAMVFVTIACFAALFVTFLINRSMIEVANSLPNDRHVVLEQLESVFLSSLVWTGLVLVPAMLLFGILVTFRVAGPAHRLESFLRSIAAGDPAATRCTLRERDELQDLCDAVNAAVDTLRRDRATDEQPAAGEPPAADPAAVETAPTEAGFAIIVALITVVILLATILTAVTSFRSHASQVERRGEDYELESAIENATNVAIHDLWSDFRAEVDAGTHADSVAGMRDFLSAIGCTDQAGVATPVRFDLGAYAGLDFDGDGALELANANLESLTMVRIDTGDVTEIAVTTTAGARSNRVLRNGSGWQRTLETTFALEPEAWGGLEYVLLANNVNCALCHLTADTTDRVYGLGTGPFQRVKVGTLEQLMMRSWADSEIRGTLHAAGPITDPVGNPITDWATAPLTSVEFDVDGNVIVDGFGEPIPTPMVPANGSVDPGGNLYQGYASTSMVDGALPAAFPPPFPDDGGIDPLTGAPTTAGAANRRVDPGEFHAVTRNFHGSVSGGRIYVVPPGSRIDTSSSLGDALTTSNTTFIDRTIAGQVFLTGTLADPILLNGDVAIDGNLVIRGHVKGTGALWVSENAYAPVDVEYFDGVDSGGARTFGRAADGTENLLVLTAGGNVVLGDPFQPYRAGTSREGDKPSFAYMEMSSFNRAEWKKTQPALPGASGSNPNPTYVPGYVPRYYARTDGEAIGIFNQAGGYFDAVTGTWLGPEHPDRWNTSWMTFADPSDPADPLIYDAGGAPIAQVVYLGAANTWITDARLDELMDLTNATRPSGPLHLDLFAYTNNAIFGIVGTITRNHEGKLRINGGVVAADVGLLATQGTELNYDSRVLDVLRIQGSESVVVRRSMTRVVE